MNPIEARKEDHIRVSLEEDVQARSVRTGFDRYVFIHQALPELDFAEISTETKFLGRTFAAPLLISSMTGGLERGRTINRNLAQAAQRMNVPMGLGSQRITRERPETLDSFLVRDVAPDVFLIGNVGAVQLNYGFDVETCRELVRSVGADALYLHLNPLQEVVQPEGDTNFKGLLPKIETLCRELGVPVLAKEVGSGIAPDTARRLVEAGVAAIDVAGTGGTSWAAIEGLRATSNVARSLGELFRDWGLPTSESLKLCRRELPDTPLVASGGIRTGLDVAKALALGADLAATAHPFLEAATTSSEAVEAVIHRLVTELKVVMFCLGCRTIDELRRTDRLREVS
ncbi:type 2 isopentenyl-diphosphate Delta-isomerase [bacterium]|nr:type 2 isopentenyl-diphosphate Delta-isomerase [bacterium]